MAPSDEERSPAVSALGWVQDQLHLVKAQLGKVQHQMDQTQAMALDAVEKLRAQEAALNGVLAQSNALAPLQDELRQVKDLLARLQEQQVQTRNQSDELARQRAAEVERERVERSDLLRRLGDLEHEVESWLERQSGVEEAARHYQEGVALSNLRLEALDRRLEQVESKASRSLEAANRVDQEMSRVDATLMELAREDEVQAERARVALEAARRLEGDVSADRRDLAGLNQLSERVELLRVERQRLEDRLAAAEESMEELRSLLAKQEQLIGVLEGRTQGYHGRLESLRDELLRNRQQLVEHLRKLSTGQERVKKRQIGDLEREIQELKKHAIGLAEE